VGSASSVPGRVDGAAAGRIVAVPEVNGYTIATTAPPHSPRLTSLSSVMSLDSGTNTTLRGVGRHYRGIR
jgi:hypothetical protein